MGRLRIATWNISGGRRSRSTAVFDYEEEAQLAYFAEQLKRVAPDIVCLQETQSTAGDFNTPDPAATFAATFRHFGLTDATPPEPTKPGIDGHLDAIFAHHRFSVTASAVVPTENDHYLCWAELVEG